MLDEALAIILVFLLVAVVMILIVPYFLYPDMIKDNVIKHISVREGSEVQ
jgi:uncharacterized protein involved in outer membrane biogenesis